MEGAQEGMEEVASRPQEVVGTRLGIDKREHMEGPVEGEVGDMVEGREIRVAEGVTLVAGEAL